MLPKPLLYAGAAALLFASALAADATIDEETVAASKKEKKSVPYGHGHHEPSPYHPEPPKHKPSYGTPERNCSIDYQHVEASVCVPALETECINEEITVKVPVDEEKCVDVSTTSCRAVINSQDVEVCFYEYERQEQDSQAKVVDVKYDKSCDTKYVEMCHYRVFGHGYNHDSKKECKEIPEETCINKPLTESRDTPVTVRLPQPVRRCVNKRVTLPDVVCETTREQRCFPLVRLQEEKRTLEKCVTHLTDHKCTKAILELPEQTCEEVLKDLPTEYKTH